MHPTHPRWSSNPIPFLSTHYIQTKPSPREKKGEHSLVEEMEVALSMLCCLRGGGPRKWKGGGAAPRAESPAGGAAAGRAAWAPVSPGRTGGGGQDDRGASGPPSRRCAVTAAPSKRQRRSTHSRASSSHPRTEESADLLQSQVGRVDVLTGRTTACLHQERSRAPAVPKGGPQARKERVLEMLRAGIRPSPQPLPPREAQEGREGEGGCTKELPPTPPSAGALSRSGPSGPALTSSG